MTKKIKITSIACCLLILALCVTTAFGTLSASASDAEVECDCSYSPEGFCYYCDGYQQPPKLPGHSDTYRVSNAGHLFWFSNAINNSLISYTSNIWFECDIRIPQMLPFDYNTGTFVGDHSKLLQWIPIGGAETETGYGVTFKGAVYGNGHSLGGLYTVDSSFAGFIGEGSGVRIENLHINESYFSYEKTNSTQRNSHVGSFVGNAVEMTLVNCTSTATLKIACGSVGGIAGVAYVSTLENCGFWGQILVSDDSSFKNVGGIVGTSTSDHTFGALHSQNIFKGCYSSGSLPTPTQNTFVGVVSGSTQHGEYNPIYVMDTETLDVYGRVDILFIDSSTSTLLPPSKTETVSLTASQFYNGTLCELLGTHPTIGGRCRLCTYLCENHEFEGLSCKHCGTSMTLVSSIDATVPTDMFEDDSIPLQAVAYPQNATYTDVVWSVDSGDATVDTRHVLKVGAAGTVILRATVVNGLGMGNNFSKTYTISVASKSVYDISDAMTGYGEHLSISESGGMINITYNGNTTQVPLGTQIVITGNHTASGESEFHVSVSGGGFTAPINLKLKDCTIFNNPSGSTHSPLTIRDGANVNLVIEGNVKLETAANNSSAVWVADGASLTIDGTGTLTANGGPGGTAIGNSLYYSEHGDITINGGTINANGGTLTSSSSGGPGIGGTSSSLGGNITINGGTVTATGGYQSAGIGGGYSSSAGNITINGGTVIATGYSDGGETGGAGIGNGYEGKGGTITITGGTVTATGGYNSAGIGGGDSGYPSATNTYGRVDKITITGGTVTATGHHLGADIGAGRKASSGDIVICGGNIIMARDSLGSGSGASGIALTSVTDGRGNVIKRLTVTLNGVADGQPLQSIPGLDYNVDGIKTVNGGKLYLWVPENAVIESIVVGGTTYYTIPALGDVTFHDHKHNPKLVAEQNGVLSLVCQEDGCHLEDMGAITVTLPESLEYTGNAIEVSVSDTRLIGSSQYTLTYTGENLVEGKPVKAGDYSAIISADGVTSEIRFTVTHTNHETEIVVDGDVHVYSCACGYALSEKHDDTTNDHLCDTCNERFTPCNFVDNYCTVCRAFDSPQPVTQTYYPELYETHAGYYVIKNAEQLVWVAEYISSAEDRSMNFILVTDIEFNKGYDFRFIEDSGLVEITKDGEPIAYVGTGVAGLAIDGGSAVFDTTASVKGTVYTDALGTVFTGSQEESPLAALDQWFPIGRMYFEYAGTFDGNGHKVSGLFMMSGAERVGLIGSTTGTVRNLGVERSFIYTTGTFYGGLVVGLGADVENCYSHGIIVAERIVGGIVGGATSVKDSYSTATVIGSSYTGAVVGQSNATVINSYYLDTSETDSHEGIIFKTAEAFACGEVAYLLASGGGAWGQVLGENGAPYPSINAPKVYYGYVCNETVTDKIYTNDSGASETEKPDHNLSAATCTQAPTCNACGAVKGNSLGHDMVADKGKAPTCTETGLTDGAHCSRCDGATTPQQEIPALGHDMVTDKGKAPTCTETGLTDGAHCSRCDGATTPQEEIPATDHSWIGATYDSPKTCSECGATEGKPLEKETESEGETKAEVESNTDTKAETESETRSEAETESETRSEAETESVTESESKTETKTETESEVETESESASSGSQGGNQTQETESQTETETQKKTPDAPSGNNNADKGTQKGGCGSSIGAGAVSLVAVISLAGFAIKKKKVG